MATPQRARGFARGLLWPISRFFDPRFRGIGTQVDTVHQDLVTRHDELVRRLDEARETEREAEREALRDQHATTMTALAELRELVAVDMDSATEAATAIGMALSEISTALSEISASLDGAEETLEDLRKRLDHEALVGAPVSRLHQPAADLLNYGASHRGFAAQKGVWFNPPVTVEHVEGDVRLGGLNERIIEVPYVLRALLAVPAGSRILDVGANESTLAVSLATLGYQVTALDLTPYAFEHPMLERVASPIEDWDTPETFDAVICLSTIEHIGIGAYGEATQREDGDVAAIARIRQLVAPDGIVILTTPYGNRAEMLVAERIYDRHALDRLLDRWEVEDMTIAVQESDLVWRTSRDGKVPQSARAVALVTARPAG